MSSREALFTGAALVICAGILWLDARTSADTVESFLLPLAFVAIYPIRRNGAVALILAVAIAVVIAGALLEEETETLEAVLINRGMTIVVLVGIAFLLRRVNDAAQELSRLATTDPLTGIFNRRHFMALLTLERQRSERYNTDLSILMLDIDHFKRINDTYGHQIGDEAIKATAGAARKSLRPFDMIGRVGGEEFVVMLPHTAEAGAVVAAERVRAAVGELVVPAGAQQVMFTISIGVATHMRNATVEQLLDCADKALYAAKTGGRNQVCVGRLAGRDGAPAAALAPA